MKNKSDIFSMSFKASLKAVLPKWAIDILRSMYRIIRAIILYLEHKIVKIRHIKKKGMLVPAFTYEDDRYAVRRVLKYNYKLLPNEYLSTLEEADSDNPESLTRFSIGYPAWNLLYYQLLCSLPYSKRLPVVLEVGTNMGSSTIIMAQALKDSGAEGILRTVDIDEKVVNIARENISRANLSDRVEFHVQDSIEYLQQLVSEVEYIDFAFIDGNHDFNYVIREFSIVYPRIVACFGKVYFDNTIIGGVADALKFIKAVYGGNIIEFNNCSKYPPGNATWQP